MDNHDILYVMGIMGLGGFGALGVLALGVFRNMRELSGTHAASLRALFREYAASLENHKAIETLGVDGMRGVVARSQVQPSVLDYDEEPEPSPDKIRDTGQYVDVGHMATIGPEEYAAQHSPDREEP